MPPSSAALRILSAFVKASLRRAVGDPTLQAVAEELTTLGQEDLARRLDALLGHPDRRQALAAALERADACVQRRLQATLPDLAPLADAGRGLPLRDLPAVLEALADLPADDLDEGRLRRAVLAVIRRDWQAATPQQAETVADAYLLCLREALLGVETDALRTVGRAVLRTEQAVKRLEQALQAREGKARRDIHIQGQVNQAVFITGDHNVVQVFLRAVRVDHRPRVRRFLEEYLGTPGAPVPFGGRRRELEILTRWLEEDTRHPYFFLYGPAGRGKSALLTRWATALASGDDWAVLFVPISLRVDTHRAPVFLHLLAQGLTHLYEPDKTLDETNPEVLLSVASGYLERRQPPPGRKGLLVVLDGLDEATWPQGEAAWRTLFPREPGPHLRVVAAARVLATADVTGWLTRLNWRPGLTRRHRLERLSQSGVREVLAQMRVPLDALSRDVNLVQRLYHLTDQGDPLLVGLYAQDLLQTLEEEGLEAARQRAQRIAQLVGSGYETFVEQYWWPELTRWWRAQGLPGDTEARVREILDLLALARGLIPEPDLLHLARQGPLGARLDLDHYTLDRVWENLARVVLRRKEAHTFLVTFTHPRLREYFKERLTHRDPERLREMTHRYRAWIEAEVARIAASEKPVRDASPYVLQYAVEHLSEAPLETLLPLVTQPGWHRTREAVEGSYAGYLSDVQAVWKRARQINEQRLTANRQPQIVNRSSQIAHRQPLPAIGLEIRCALIEASLHSLAGNLPPKLPALLVENDQWTPPRALAHVRQMPHDMQKAQALEALVPVLARREPARLEDALATARSIDNEGYRARALASLAPHLPEGLLTEALEAAQSIRNKWYRARALLSLAPHLPPDLLAEALSSLAPRLPPKLRGQALSEALAAARSIGKVWYRTRALSPLAPRLPPDLLAEALSSLAPHLSAGLLAKALDAARSIWDADARARALASLAPYLPAELRGQALTEALATARSIEDADDRTEALAALAPHLPAELLAEALAAARSIGWEPVRARALASLAPHLPPELLTQALAAARSLPEEGILGSPRAEALASLAPRLPEGRREEALAEALTAARRIRDEGRRARALSSLAPHLPPGLLAQALAAAWSIGDKEYRTKALASLASHLPEGLREQALSEALAAARSIRNTLDRARALAFLAPHLSAGLLAEALDAARSIRNTLDRARALASLAPYLPAELRGQALTEALATARSIEDADDRTEALAALAPHLPAELLAEALVAARSIGWEPARTRALASLAPHLPPELLTQALAAARSIENEYARAEALASLASHLPPGLLAEALAAARSIGDEEYRARALAILAPHLPPELREQALAAARRIGDKEYRTKALASLASHLPEGLREQALSEALAAAQSIRDEGDRAWALATLAPHLPAALLSEALDAARSIGDEYVRARALAALAPHLPPELREQTLSEALAAARSIGDEYVRARALAALAPHLPPALQEQALSEALSAARSIERENARAEALAALAPHLPEELREQALAEARAAARRIWYANARARALAALAPHLPAALREQALSEALAAARRIRDEYDRADALASLAPHLPPELREQALEAAQGIGDADARARALAALAPRLAESPAECLYPLWAETLPILARRPRRHLLADLRAFAPVIHALGGPEAVGETFRAIQDVGRWWP